MTDQPDDLLRDLAKDIPWDRPTAARRDAVRSSLLVEAAESVDARVVAPRRWTTIGAAFTAGALAAAAIALLVLRRPTPALDVTPAQITATTPDTRFEHRVVATETGVDEIVQLHTGKLAITVPPVRQGDRVRLQTKTAEVEGNAGGDPNGSVMEIEVVADALQVVTVKSGSARVIVAGQAPVFLATGQTWRASVIVTDLSPSDPKANDAKRVAMADTAAPSNDPIDPTATTAPAPAATTSASTPTSTAPATASAVAPKATAPAPAISTSTAPAPSAPAPKTDPAPNAPAATAPKTAPAPTASVSTASKATPASTASAPTASKAAPASTASASTASKAPAPGASASTAPNAAPAPTASVSTAPKSTTPSAPGPSPTTPGPAAQAPTTAPPTPSVASGTQRTVEAKPDSRLVIEKRFRAGWELLRAGKALEAAAELGAAADAAPDQPLAADARYWQATALIRAGQPRAAERVLVQFLDRASRSLRRGRAAVLLGRVLAERGDRASATAWFESAIHDPDPAIADAARAGLQALQKTK